MRARLYAFKRFVLMPIVCVLLLAGCTIEQHVSVYSNEEWDVQTVFNLSKEIAGQMGQGSSSMDVQFQKQAAEWESKGAKVSYKKEEDKDNIKYVLSTSGKGWELLNTVAFDDKAVITSHDDVVDIQFKRASSLDASTFTLRISGKEIMETNADKKEGSTAIWFNVEPDSPAHISLKAGSRSLLNGTVLAVIGLLALVGGAGYFFMQRSRRQTQTGAAEHGFQAVVRPEQGATMQVQKDSVEAGSVDPNAAKVGAVETGAVVTSQSDASSPEAMS